MGIRRLRRNWTGGQVLAWAVLIVAILAVLTPVSPTFGKDLDLIGTVDCGARSGDACIIGDALSIWTTDVDGTRRLVSVDVSWIRKQLPDLDQDDLIHLEVRDFGDGNFTVIALYLVSDGTHVQGSSTGSHLVAEGGNRCPNGCDSSTRMAAATRLQPRRRARPRRLP